MFPRRTSANVLDRDTTKTLLDVLDIGPCVFRQVLILCDTHCVALPARQRDILNLELLDDVRISRERVVATRAVRQDVRNTDLDLIKVVQNIQLGEVQRGVVVDRLRVTRKDEVEPTAATTTAGRDSELSTDFLEFLANLVELLRGEGARANTGGVGFYDTNDVLDAGRVKGETLDGTTETGGRRGHVRVGAVVEVEEESVGTFHQRVRVILVALQEGKLVNDVGFQDFAVILCKSLATRRPSPSNVYRWSRFQAPGKTNLEHLNLILDVVVQVAKSCAIPSLQVSQLALEDSLIQKLTNAHTASRGLVTVARSNTLARGSDLAATELGLLQTVDHRVQLEAHVRTVRDEDALASSRQTLLLQRSQFLEEAGDVHDGTGTDQVDAFRRDEARGQDVEVVGHIVVHNRVASVFFKTPSRQPHLGQARFR